MAPLRVSSSWHTIIITSTFFTSILASHITLIVHSAPAKEKENPEVPDGLSTFLQSWAWATFGISILGELFAIILLPTTIQALSRYLKNKRNTRRPPTGVWNTGGWFCAFAIMASIFLASFYPLYVVQYLAREIWDTGSITHSLIPSGMVNLTEDMVDITILCAFFALLHHRQSVFFPETLSTPGTILKALLILVMTIVTAAKTALVCMLSTYEVPSRYRSTVDLFRVYIAVYIAATFALIVSAFLMERKLGKAGLEDQVGSELGQPLKLKLYYALEVADYTDIPPPPQLISKTMIRRVCPLLGAQALFRLADEIIANLPVQKVQHINYDALTLFEAAVKFIGCTFSLAFVF